jgi:hypothetical protein
MSISIAVLFAGSPEGLHFFISNSTYIVSFLYKIDDKIVLKRIPHKNVELYL